MARRNDSHVVAIDCGTTRIKAAIVNSAGGLQGIAERPCPMRSLPGGRIEFSADALASACEDAVREALTVSGVAPARVAALALTNQRATVLCVDARGHPIGRAISWQDMRGAAEIERLRARVPDARYRAITGLPNHPVFTLAKLLWLRRHDATRFKRTAHFALVQDYLLRRLGADDHYLDRSNASLTGLLDVQRLEWSEDVLGLCGLDAARLPTLVESGQPVGVLSPRAAHRTGLRAGTPLVAGGGDQQCAGIGAGAVVPGIVEITVGTAAAPLACTSRPIHDPRGRVTTCAHAVPGAWEIEGLQSSAGSSLEWLSHVANGGARFDRAFFAEVARVPPGARGVLFLPYLAGASAPHWVGAARGAFLGLTRAHGRADLARAVFEGVSLQTREILDVFHSLRTPAREIRLTGGCTAIEAWNQVQADIYGRPVATLATREATLMGAAILAACGVGVHASVAEAARCMVKIQRTYRPEPSAAARYERLYRRYQTLDAEITRGPAADAAREWGN